MKAVLDVGQFVSAAINPHGHPAQLLMAWHDGRFELVTSLPILNDLRRVLGYPHIRKRHQWRDDEIEVFIDFLAMAATLTPGNLPIAVITQDPTDDKVLASAVEGQVDYVVASDRHLTDLHSYAGIPIVRPRAFLELLSAESDAEPAA